MSLGLPDYSFCEHTNLVLRELGLLSATDEGHVVRPANHLGHGDTAIEIYGSSLRLVHS